MGLAVTPFVAGAQRAEGDRVIELHIDQPPDADKVLTSWLTYGAELQLTLEQQTDFDLDENANDDVTFFEPQLAVAFSVAPSEAVRGFLEMEFRSAELVEAPDGTRDPSTEIELKQIYLAFPNFYRGVSLQVGRQEFIDEREWFYDADLDAARLFVGGGRTGLELSASRDQLFDRDLLNAEVDPNTNRFILVGRYAISPDIEASAYVLVQDDGTEDDEDTRFFGVESRGDLSDSLDYWLNAALVRGETRGIDIRGYGVDLGGTFRADFSFQPSLTLGLAFGSGDRNPDDRVDYGFRQTGLHNNQAKFGGVTRFSYYGEALKPELSNLLILTGGVGVRPTSESSLDLVYHYYRQDEPIDELRDANITMDPDGRHAEIGHGFDIIVGYDEIEDVEIELNLGVFFPGRAFSSDAEPAYFGGLELTYSF